MQNVTLDHGLSIAILSTLAMFAWYMMRRLFDENKGMLPIYLRQHKDFHDKLTDHLSTQQAQLNDTDSHVALLDNTLTNQTNKSLSDLARVELVKIRARDNIDPEDKQAIVTLLTAIVQRLEPPGQREVPNGKIS